MANDKQAIDEALTTHFVMGANELNELEKGYGVPQERIWETLATAYTNLTGDEVSPTPTHRERELHFHSEFDLTEWVEMTDEEREQMTADVMADLLQEVAGGA